MSDIEHIPPDITCTVTADILELVPEFLKKKLGYCWKY